jgi:hypothetical protein
MLTFDGCCPKSAQPAASEPNEECLQQRTCARTITRQPKARNNLPGSRWPATPPCHPMRAGPSLRTEQLGHTQTWPCQRPHGAPGGSRTGRSRLNSPVYRLPSLSAGPTLTKCGARLTVKATVSLKASARNSKCFDSKASRCGRCPLIGSGLNVMMSSDCQKCYRHGSAKSTPARHCVIGNCTSAKVATSDLPPQGQHGHRLTAALRSINNQASNRTEQNKHRP